MAEREYTDKASAYELKVQGKVSLLTHSMCVPSACFVKVLVLGLGHVLVLGCIGAG